MINTTKKTNENLHHVATSQTSMQWELKCFWTGTKGPYIVLKCSAVFYAAKKSRQSSRFSLHPAFRTCLC